ncbi:DeoR/GlpR family DNA-binding transcription regulator [Marivita sp. S0852]|uniref:DeoR/GlpR family DNA-binding transcription regulator n=1 Tax=Marivita sp. S0852 TaxID=3373893 RepID=UPI00398232A7
MTHQNLHISKDLDGAKRLKKTDRRKQILLELKLSPHVRITELAKRFNVSAETIRRDVDSLAQDGFINRAHGGATAPAQGHYPSLNERATARTAQRERIGAAAAQLVREGETVMIDSGATTIQMARSLAYLETPCTVVTNSIPVAMTLGHGVCDVLMCPGQYLAAESAVIGTETLEFLGRFHVDHAVIGASGLTEEGPSETVQGFAAVKRMMLRRATNRHLLIDSDKFGRKGLASVSELDDLTTIVVDQKPNGRLLTALDASEVALKIAD